MQYLYQINEANKFSLNKPVNTNRVYYSELMEWFTNNAFRSFSLKYVVDGTIHYRCGRKEYKVEEDHFLLTGKQPGVRAYFDSRQPVKSICIDICPSSIDEVFTMLQAKTDHDLDNYMSGDFEHPYFFEQVYSVKESMFGAQLQKLSYALSNGLYDADMINEEWFLHLVEKIILQEKNNCTSLKNIEAKKPSTRKEIYERLLDAKIFMNERYLQNPEIAAIARHCNLSVYHFFRSFKQAFAVSPYQYMMHLRLQHAIDLMQDAENTISTTAMLCGFPDVFTFSKAFKRQYGLSPNHYMRSRFAITSSTKL